MNIWVITHLYPSPEKPRTGFFVHESIKALQELSHTFKVFFFVPWIPSRFHHFFPEKYSYLPLFSYNLDGVDVTPVKYLPRLSIVSPKLDTLCKQILLSKSASSLDKNPPDVIYSQSLYPDCPIAVALAKINHCPLVTIMIGSDVNLYPQKDLRVKKLIMEALPDTNRVLTVSEALYQDARKILNIPSVDILYTACDTSTFYKRTPIRNPPRKLIFIGALVPAKGVFELIEAISQLTHNFPDIELVLAGESTYRQKLENIVREKHLEKHVRFLGFIEHSHMPDVLNAADVLIFPSHHEGLPNSVVEAVACERAVVVSNVGGAKEIAPDSFSYIRIPPKDPQAIVQAIATVLQTDVGVLRESAVKGRDFVVNRFGLQENTRCLEKILLDVVNPEG